MDWGCAFQFANLPGFGADNRFANIRVLEELQGSQEDGVRRGFSIARRTKPRVKDV